MVRRVMLLMDYVLHIHNFLHPPIQRDCEQSARSASNTDDTMVHSTERWKEHSVEKSTERSVQCRGTAAPDTDDLKMAQSWATIGMPWSDVTTNGLAKLQVIAA